MPWGEILRKEREKMGLSLDKVEEETKIRKYYLEMMENEDFASLPPQVYATGFVKRYAKLLKLDEHEMVNEFKRLAYSSDQPEEHVAVHQETVATENKIPWKNVIAGIIFLVAVIWGGNYLAGVIGNQSVKNAVPTPEAQQKDQTPNPSNQNKPATVKNQGVNIEIAAQKNCWLQVFVDGEKEYEGIIVAKEKRKFVGKQSVYLKAGNAGGIEVTYNGKKQPPLGNIGEVMDKEYLAPKQEAGQE